MVVLASVPIYFAYKAYFEDDVSQAYKGRRFEMN